MKMSQGYERTHETTASRPGGLKFVYETFILMVSVILHLPSRGMSKAEQEITCHLTECEKSNNTRSHICFAFFIAFCTRDCIYLYLYLFFPPNPS